jgi:hypothetical protein
MAFSYDAFKATLDQQHNWPEVYMFKFIVPVDKEASISELFPDIRLSSKKSKSGKYVSCTAKLVVESSEEVISIYKEAHKIEGIIAL